MKRPASAASTPKTKKAKLPRGDDPAEVRASLFKSGGLFSAGDDSPGKFVLVGPGYGKFKSAKPLELYYFAIRALGQLPQLCCEIAGHPYTYTVMNVNYFNSHLKESLEFGRMPMVHTADNKELVQSSAVLRYVARRVGMAGKGESDVARCDMWYEMFKSEGKLDDEQLKKLLEAEVLPELDGNLKSISRRDTMELSESQKNGNALKFWDDTIGKSKSGFIMPFCSYVDVALFWSLRTHKALLEKCGCAKLSDYVTKFEGMPGFKRMVESKRIMPDMGPGYMYQEDDLATLSPVA